VKRSPITRKTPLKATKPLKATRATGEASKPRTRPIRPKKRAPEDFAKKKKQWERAYGSVERVEFIAALPCIACGMRPCDNAHGPDSDSGMGRKGSYRSIVPLCKGPSGCHAALHRIGVQSFQKQARVDLKASALATALAWERHNGDIG
jgi:hypothetical protein